MGIVHQDYDFKVMYRPGKCNLNSDGLSIQCWTLTEKDKLL